jgi:hypothetical protein
MNAGMPELKLCFEAAGFSSTNVAVSENVVFDARSASTALERRAEQAMHAELGHSFGTFVLARYLRDLIEADPFAEFDLAPGASGSPSPQSGGAEIALPIERDGASIIKASAAGVFSAYLPDPKKGPVFMTLLERSFGKDITTRTLDTVIKCARA